MVLHSRETSHKKDINKVDNRMKKEIFETTEAPVLMPPGAGVAIIPGATPRVFLPGVNGEAVEFTGGGGGGVTRDWKKIGDADGGSFRPNWSGDLYYCMYEEDGLNIIEFVGNVSNSVAAVAATSMVTMPSDVTAYFLTYFTSQNIQVALNVISSGNTAAPFVCMGEFAVLSARLQRPADSAPQFEVDAIIDINLKLIGH